MPPYKDVTQQGDPTREPSLLVGLGPHGEVPASIDQLQLSDQVAAKALAGRFAVAVVLHTTSSDWAAQQLAGIEETLGRYGGKVLTVVDCRYGAARQIDQLQAMIASQPDAIISIPVDNVLTADAHREVAKAGIKLVLMDNAPVGMHPGKDYVTVVSSDNFGNGQVAAEILSEHLVPNAVVGVVAFGVDFFVTKEREIGFRKWLKERRPDVAVRRVQFVELSAAGDVALDFLSANPEVGALFALWDEPAMQIVRALRSRGRRIPIATIDLGNEVAVEIARGEILKGVGAQRPYDLGVAEARAAILALTGVEPPPWIAIPALSVTRANLVEAYETVWHGPAPTELRQALRSTI